MKLWIIGSKGFLGSVLCKLSKAKHIKFVESGKEEADITQLEHLKKFSHSSACNKVTHIINCAAFTDLDLAEKNPQQAFLVNATGPENIGVVAKEMHAQLIHISTDYIFDGNLKKPYCESDAGQALNVYGKSKLEGEKKLLIVNPQACIIRSSWLFGKGGKNFISSVFQKMQRETSLKVVTDQRGRPTFVEDLAHVILELLCHSGIYHFANAGEVSRFDIAQEIFARARALHIPLACTNIIPITSDAFPTPAQRPSYSVLNTKKVESILGKSPRKWTDALDEYLCAIKTS